VNNCETKDKDSVSVLDRTKQWYEEIHFIQPKRHRGKSGLGMDAEHSEEKI